jgi:sialate O-acetylesterase
VTWKIFFTRVSFVKAQLKFRRKIILTFVLLAVASPALADVQPNALFGDNAVLQQGMEVPVWGTARDGETVTVEFQCQRKSTIAKDGKWMIHLDKVDSGGPFEMIIAGDNVLRFTNVVVGDVWLCSGQSNMQFGMSADCNAKAELSKANHSNLRLFVVSLNTAFAPQSAIRLDSSNKLEGHWQICTPETLLKDGNWSKYPGFSAVAYYFGRDIHEFTGQPVGLIGSYYGATLVEAWTSLAALQQDGTHSNYIAAYDAVLAKSESAGLTAAKPGINTPSVVFNAMIQPLIPYAIKGVIWYQGEQNAANPDDYATVFKLMVRDWRHRWGLGDFPFIFVQIAGYHAPQKQPSEGGWAWLREQQLKSLAVPDTAMASAMYLGARFDVHPRDKLDVGHRLALAAEHIAYGKQLVYSGPIYDSMKIEGGRIRIAFRHVGGGLKMGTPPWTPSGKLPPTPTRLTGFAIAGTDRKWVWADAVIDGNTVLVSSPEIKNPVAVRYGWASFPVCNLYNAEGLPASSFRTDAWRED